MPKQHDITSAREMDVLYRESDKLYYELARNCGLRLHHAARDREQLLVLQADRELRAQDA